MNHTRSNNFERKQERIYYREETLEENDGFTSISK